MRAVLSASCSPSDVASSRCCWYLATAVSIGVIPISPAWIAPASASAAMNASDIPIPVEGSFWCPASPTSAQPGPARAAVSVGQIVGAYEAVRPFGVGHCVAQPLDQREGIEEVRFDIVLRGSELTHRGADVHAGELVVGGPHEDQATMACVE